MIALLPFYPDYQSSAAKWIGEIPKHWNCLPHRAIFQEVIEKGHPDEQMLSVTIGKGVIRQSDLLANSSKKDSSNENKASYKLVLPGELAYNKMRAWQGAVGLSRYRGIISPAYIVVKPRGNVEPEYYHYLFRTPAFAKEAERWSYGITSDQWSLRSEDFKQIYSAIPPVEEQKAIVRFLKHADGLISKYIRSKKKLIDLLNEQKQAIIQQAVTRGLNPDVKMKHSGVDWLGDIPEHWEARKLGSIGFFDKGRGISRADICAQGCPAITYGDIYTQYGIETKSLRKFVTPQTAGAAKPILSGDLLFTASGETIEDIGKTTLYSGSIPGYAGGDIIIFRPDISNALFLSYALNSHSCVRQKSAYGRGDIIVHISASKLKQVVIFIPPGEEQNAIARFLDTSLSTIGATINQSLSQINLMAEYRTRLISDVVTGKIDVRNAELPDSIEELEIDEASTTDGAEEFEEKIVNAD